MDPRFPRPRADRPTRRALLLSALPLVSALATGCATRPPDPPRAIPVLPTPAPAGPGSRSTRALADTRVNPLGVNSFLDREVEDWKKEYTFQLMREAGIGWLKQYFPWEEIETSRGQYTWSKFDQIVDLATKYGIRIIARMDRPPEWARRPGDPEEGPPARYEDFATFVATLARRYRGKVEHVQVWNEPNIYPEWGNRAVNPAEYVDMLRIVYRAAKAANPELKVLNAPLAITLETGGRNLNELDYLDGMYRAGAREYFDICSANAYGLEYPPEDAPTRDKLNFRRVELLREVMRRNGDEGKAVWFNEFGWNASPATMDPDRLIWRRVTADEQARYTLNAYRYAAENYPWAGVICMWYFRQVGDILPERSDYFFRLINVDFSPTPLYLAIKDNQAIIQKMWE